MSFTALKSLLMQTYPPRPNFTDKDLPDLTGKVCIVTGANTGVGKEVAQMLYAHNATVYLAARSESKTRKAMNDITASIPKSPHGQLCYLPLDLSDLRKVKQAAEEFKTREKKLDLLINNAGVAWPEHGSKTAQGYELQLGVNCVGHFLFTKLLIPSLLTAVQMSPPNSVRVVWTSSSATEGIRVKGFMDNLDYHIDKSSHHKYCLSKIGNYFHASEMAKRYRDHGLISVSLNPGNLASDLWRTHTPFVTWLLRTLLLYPSVYGAYTTIFAALSPKISMQNTGVFIAPWGRPWYLSPEKENAAKSREEGGAGIAEEFWRWSEAQVAPYL